MELAIEEAYKGVGLTSPNPCVGAVIVKGGQLLGKGWHTQAGAPHAEREAIADAIRQHGENALRGASIYVTLEPCSTYGRTPPCTQGILEKGLCRVIYGATDPNPQHAGGAKALLMKEGVEVIENFENEACLKIIQSFSKKQKTGLPWVVLKSAMSLDGRITRPPGEGQWLSSAESRQHVQRMRFESDAIITGGNTLRIDNPALTLRGDFPQNKTQPWRMVITRGKREGLPADAVLFTDAEAHRTLVQEDGDLKAALMTLADKGCNKVLVEAGGRLMSAFLDAGLADEVALFYAPMLTGGPNASFLGLLNDVKLKNQQFTQIGKDVLLRAQVVSE